MSNVTVLRKTALNDVPGMLRQLAEEIEEGDVAAPSVLVIIPRETDYPDIRGFGDHLGDYGNIAVCELAKQFFLTNKVARS